MEIPSSNRTRASLEETVALVAGGTGTVGEGITRVLLERGASVVVPSRSREPLEALTGRIAPVDRDRLVGVQANAAKPIGAEEVRREIGRRFGGQLDLVVASAGRCEQRPALKDVKLAVWNRLLEHHLTSHLVLAQTFLPVLSGGGRYVMIGWASGQKPYVGGGLASAIEAAKTRVARTLAAEEGAGGASVTELVLRARMPSGQKGERDEWIAAEEVGTFVAGLAGLSSRERTGETIRLENRAHLTEELNALSAFDS